VTGINSDLPGTVIARVREEVCDTVSGRYTLIPQNATLMGRYDSMIAWGQERVLFCWDRLTLPNGDKIKLGCMPAADLTGQAGLTGEVNEHWWRLIKGAVLASIFSAGISAAGGDTTNYHPTVPQNMAHGAAEEIGRAGEAITRKNLNMQPTIETPPGTPFNVMVTQTMILRPYRATPCGGDR
jgi:type IV secretion system protein VirB10